MTDTEWAYLAGILDGEGCITSYFNKRGSCYIRIRVTQVNRPVITWLEEVVGGRVWHSHERVFGKPGYTWGCEGVLAREILRGTYKYLTYKKPQARVAYLIHQVPKEKRVPLHVHLRALKQRQEAC